MGNIIKLFFLVSALLVYAFAAGFAGHFDQLHYRLLVKKSVPDLGRDASGVTYNAKTKTLYVVSDVAEIYEITIEGDVIRKVELSGFEDTEGIVHIKEDQFALVEEQRGRFDIVQIGKEVRKVDILNAALYEIDPNPGHESLEGIAYDAASDVFLLVREERPRTIYRAKPKGRRVEVSNPFDAEYLPIKDISDIAYNPRVSPNLFILSEESKRILEVDMTGQVLSSFGLIPHMFFSTPEGLTFDDQGRLYVVAEGSAENFYVFEPKK